METNKPAREYRRLSARSVIAGGVLAVLAALPVTVPTTAKADSSREAFAVRQLQSEMMVAALSCQMRGSYNTVVARFERELVSHGQSLREYFRQAHGNRGQRELDRFITAMANQASSDMIAAGGAYCKKAGAMFDEVLALPVSSLGVYSVRRFDTDDSGLPQVESAAAQ